MCVKGVFKTWDSLVHALLVANVKCWYLERPTVSLNYEHGLSQQRKRNLTWRAHPLATASSAFSVVLGSFPKNLVILSLIAGILEAPPTISTAWMSSFFRSAQEQVTDG